MAAIVNTYTKMKVTSYKFKGSFHNGTYIDEGVVIEERDVFPDRNQVELDLQSIVDYRVEPQKVTDYRIIENKATSIDINIDLGENPFPTKET